VDLFGELAHLSLFFLQLEIVARCCLTQILLILLISFFSEAVSSHELASQLIFLILELTSRELKTPHPALELFFNNHLFSPQFSRLLHELKILVR
jgi:hypothetical protein